MARGLLKFPAMLAHIALVLAAAVSAPDADKAAPAPGMAHVDVGTVLGGPLAPAVAHMAPGKVGGTEVTLYNVNTHETLTVYLRFDGLTDDATAMSLKHYFRCKRTGRERPIYPGTLALFAQLTAHYPGHVIEIVSGVRAPGYGVKDSKHYSGHAIDFRVRGVKTKQVRDLAWKFDEEIGLGHYTGEDFLHLDNRPGDGKIAWEQRRQGSANRYNPKWAVKSVASKGDTAMVNVSGAQGDADQATERKPTRKGKARPARTLRSQQPSS